MKLLIPISINIILVIAVYLTEKKTAFKNLPYMVRQIIIGVVFGASACFASSYGVDLLGTVANVRDAAPLSAGLIFGAPAGIVSGIIGGMYRWFSVFWNAGRYTRLACTIATILAGFMAAALRKFMFDNKKPTWSYAVVITVLCEVVHMLLIFITNMGDTVYAFDFVQGATIPMIIGNVAAVGLSLLAVSVLSGEELRPKKGSEHIAETFQRWLLICIVVAYIITSVFTFILQNEMVRIETKEVFRSAIDDVNADITDGTNEVLYKTLIQVNEKLSQEPEISLEDLAEDMGLFEISIADKDGKMIRSTETELIGTSVSMEGYSSPDKDFYVYPFIPYVQGILTGVKYAGLTLESGNFLRIAYTTPQLHNKLDSKVIEVTQNRHIGSEGFMAVCDEEFKLLDQDKYKGAEVQSIGIDINEEMKKGISASKLYKADIIDIESKETETHVYVFTFKEGYCLIASMPEAEAMFMRDASLYTSVFMQVLIFATLFVFIYVLIKRVIINNLRKVNTTLGKITEGNLNVTVDVRTTEEFASLSDDINSTVSTLKRYIAEAAARIDRELEYAKQIQRSVLPKVFPDDEEYSINAQMIPAKEVGGDFYDFYKINDSTVAFLVADVSGKGIPAAMFMMTAKTIIKDLAESGMAVNDVFTRANEKLYENNESGMFVTAWMGILDIPTGKLQYANAGHNPPIIRKNNGKFEYLRPPAGFVLAGMENIKYRVNEMKLEPGDRIFLYTDGVPEATNGDEQLYGEERLLAFINENINASAGEMLPLLKEDIDRFVGDAPQFDDITMIMLDYRP